MFFIEFYLGPMIHNFLDSVCGRFDANYNIETHEWTMNQANVLAVYLVISIFPLTKH